MGDTDQINRLGKDICGGSPSLTFKGGTLVLSQGLGNVGSKKFETWGFFVTIRLMTPPTLQDSSHVDYMVMFFTCLLL